MMNWLIGQSRFMRWFGWWKWQVFYFVCWLETLFCGWHMMPLVKLVASARARDLRQIHHTRIIRSFLEKPKTHQTSPRTLYPFFQSQSTKWHSWDRWLKVATPCETTLFFSGKITLGETGTISSWRKTIPRPSRASLGLRKMWTVPLAAAAMRCEESVAKAARSWSHIWDENMEISWVSNGNIYIYNNKSGII